MEFRIMRTSNPIDRPCEEAYEKEFMRKDVRRLRSFEEYDNNNKIYGKFTDRGVNHRINEDGFIEREFKDKAWFVEINNLEDLLNIENQYGPIIVSRKRSNHMMIEIYDDQREHYNFES